MSWTCAFSCFSAVSEGGLNLLRLLFALLFIISATWELPETEQPVCTKQMLFQKLPLLMRVDEVLV